MSSLDDAERAYALAMDCQLHGDYEGMMKWMDIYQGCLADARTNLEEAETNPLRLVSRNFYARLNSGAFHKRNRCAQGMINESATSNRTRNRRAGE